MNYKKLFSKRIRNTIVVIALITSSVLTFSFVNNDFEIAKNLDVFTTLYRELNQHYVDEIQAGELIKTGIDAMLKSLDPYTVYIPESQIEDYKFMTTGQYGGIGSLIHVNGDYIYISEPYENFPAHKAGLLAGDKILEINGKDFVGKPVSDASKLLKGEAGTSIKLRILREGNDDAMEFELKREVVKIENIPYSGMVDDGIAYVKLNGFTQNAAKEVSDAFLEMKKNNEVKAFVLDLRGNGGGLLMEAVHICNIFIERGKTIVSTKGKVKSKNHTYRTSKEPLDKEIPIAVLVDESSASASEIVSGAIQDLDRGIIVGSKTFGKGLVQNVLPLSYNSKLKVTISKYYIPSGRCIQAIDYSKSKREKLADSLLTPFKTANGRLVYDKGGIEPDIKVEGEYLSNISASLMSKYLIFDYTTKFCREHESILAVDEFEITDEIYKDFSDYIADKDYDYTTRCEKLLERFKETSKKEKYYEDVSDEFIALEKKVHHNKNDDLVKFKDEIKFLLKNEIIGRYYYDKGKIKASFIEDKELKKAIELLKDEEAYKEVLRGK